MARTRKGLHAMFRGEVDAWAKASNNIEGVFDLGKHEAHADAIYDLLAAPALTIRAVEQFVATVEPGAVLRDRPGLNVVIGNHRPPVGGPDIAGMLADVLHVVNENILSPWEAHVKYETLHPFTDCNGRSGRAVWAWHMHRHYSNPFLEINGNRCDPLHLMYYQALEAGRSD